MKIKYFSWLKKITKIDEENISDINIKDIENLKNYPTSKYYFENILSIPFHNLLQKKHVNKVVKAIHKLNNENFN